MIQHKELFLKKCMFRFTVFEKNVSITSEITVPLFAATKAEKLLVFAAIGFNLL